MSLNSFVTFTSITSDSLIHPAKTSSSTLTFLGTDSPVSADVFIVVSPFTITPSTGIFSPALTTIISPTFNSSGSITFISLPFSNLQF